MNHFQAYELLNEQLFRFIMQGKSESKEAEAIRDAMDEQWEKMTPEEQDDMRKQNERVL